MYFSPSQKKKVQSYGPTLLAPSLRVFGEELFILFWLFSLELGTWCPLLIDEHLIGVYELFSHTQNDSLKCSIS